MKRHRWIKATVPAEYAREYPDEIADVCEACGLEREFVVTGTGGPDGYWLTPKGGGGAHSYTLPPCPGGGK